MSDLNRDAGKPLGGDIRVGPARSGRVILGGATFGGMGSTLSAIGSGLDDAEAYAVMDAAAELGVTVFDTADGYADGASERVIGAWLRDRGFPEQIVVTTKVGVAGGTVRGRDLSPERIDAHARRSHERLGVERIAMYMVHAVDPATPVVDSLRAFDRLHREGVIGAFGMCNATVEILREWDRAADELDAIRPSWVQNEYSLLCRRDEAEVLPYCAERGLAYTAYSPLAGGILAGRYRRGAPPPPKSRIATLPAQYGPRLTDRVHDGLDTMSGMARDRGTTVAGLALAWVMSHPLVAAPLVAPRTPRQFEAAVQATQIALTADERVAIAALMS
jgi:1-deoxyxylulose-5-phosphate synthase